MIETGSDSSSCVSRRLRRKDLASILGMTKYPPTLLSSIIPSLYLTPTDSDFGKLLNACAFTFCPGHLRLSSASPAGGRLTGSALCPPILPTGSWVPTYWSLRNLDVLRRSISGLGPQCIEAFGFSYLSYLDMNGLPRRSTSSSLRLMTAAGFFSLPSLHIVRSQPRHVPKLRTVTIALEAIFCVF